MTSYDTCKGIMCIPNNLNTSLFIIFNNAHNLRRRRDRDRCNRPIVSRFGELFKTLGNVGIEVCLAAGLTHRRRDPTNYDRRLFPRVGQ